MKSLICPVTGVNIPRFALCVLAGFVFVFAQEFVVHGLLLMPVYVETADLWRGPETMEDYYLLNLLRQIMVVALIGLLYTANHEGKGIGEGLRFGLMIGAILGVEMAAAYIWMPIPESLALAWGLAGLVQGLGLGIIFSLVYKAAEKQNIGA